MELLIRLVSNSTQCPPSTIRHSLFTTRHPPSTILSISPNSAPLPELTCGALADRWCGSNYDALGNTRFSAESIIGYFGFEMTEEQLLHQATYIEGMNWGTLGVRESGIHTSSPPRPRLLASSPPHLFAYQSETRLPLLRSHDI